MNIRNRSRKRSTGKGWYFGIGIILLLILPGCQKRGGIEHNSTPPLTKAPGVTAVLTPTPPSGDRSTPVPTGLTEEEQAEARLAELLAGMSLEEKVGQMFLARCPEGIGRAHV